MNLRRGIPPEQLLRCLHVSVVLDVRVHQDCGRVRAFGWVLPEDESDEAAQFGRSSHHFEVLSDDLAQVIPIFDLKGVLSGDQFVGQCSDRPNVYLLVVLLSHEYFWGQVERSAAEGRAELLSAVD